MWSHIADKSTPHNSLLDFLFDRRAGQLQVSAFILTRNNTWSPREWNLEFVAASLAGILVLSNAWLTI